MSVAVKLRITYPVCVFRCYVVVIFVSQIPPHLETFESPEKREAAFAKHKVDATSRRGLFGHGIYEPAKI